MYFATLEHFLGEGAGLLARGPVGLIFAEDESEIASTLRHHAALGFGAIIVFLPEGTAVPEPEAALAHWVHHGVFGPGGAPAVVNRLIAIAPEGTWFYYCFNAEYLFYPFCESRSVREMLTFHTEERRDAVLTYVVDLYASDLARHPDAVSIEDAMLDRSGYYALGRPDRVTGHMKERQLDFFGGLRWRFEEHVPRIRRKIDRIALFRSRQGLVLSEDHTFNIEEYNTYSCPWHHNLTAAIASFRTAKALRTNPGSMFDIHGFTWHNSIRFDWSSRQLMELGLMEPGQWF